MSNPRRDFRNPARQTALDISVMREETMLSLSRNPEYDVKDDSESEEKAQPPKHQKKREMSSEDRMAVKKAKGNWDESRSEEAQPSEPEGRSNAESTGSRKSDFEKTNLDSTHSRESEKGKVKRA